MSEEPNEMEVLEQGTISKVHRLLRHPQCLSEGVDGSFDQILKENYGFKRVKKYCLDKEISHSF